MTSTATYNITSDRISQFSLNFLMATELEVCTSDCECSVRTSFTLRINWTHTCVNVSVAWVVASSTTVYSRVHYGCYISDFII